MAKITTYNATDLTGGLSRSLNSISETVLIDGDRCHVSYEGNFYVYVYNALSIEAENSPSIIRPIDYIASGVWENQGVLETVATVTGLAVDNTDPNNPTIAGGSLTTIKTGNWGDTDAVDWSGLGSDFELSEFDLIFLISSHSPWVASGFGLPSIMKTAVQTSCGYRVHTSDIDAQSSVRVESVTETSLVVRVTKGTTAATPVELTGIYGIKYR